MYANYDQDKRPLLTDALKKAKEVSVLADEIGSDRATVYRALRATHKLGFDFCRKLAEFHPEYTATEYYDECKEVQK